METLFAITLAKDRISPVFDVARALTLFNQQGEIAREIELPPELSARVELIAGLGIDCLITGALTRPASFMLEQAGVRVIGFVAGQSQEVLAAFRAGRLSDERFAMPGCRGCCRHGQGRGRGRGRRRKNN